REGGMTPPELLMSESQERMMAYVRPEMLEEVLTVAEHWEIESSVVGVVGEGDMVTVRHDGEVVAEVPADSLSGGAPLYHRPVARPDWLDELWESYVPPTVASPAETLLALLSDPSIGSSAWIHEQYDHMLFLNTVVGPGGDGALIRVRGTNKGLAVSTDGNGRLCLLDPRRGAARLVFEAALNVAVAGARPLAVVDNLNFGNPEKPEVMWQLVETVEGISEACEAMGIPVVGGNVSFYNETNDRDVNPTPVVGLLGLADPMPIDPPRLQRARPGMEIWVIGPDPTPNFAGSSLQRLQGAPTGRPTAPRPDVAAPMIEDVARLAHVTPVLHDVSDGGLAVAVAEICIASGTGAVVETDDPVWLFGEDPHRVVVIAESGSALPGRRIGRMWAGDLVIGDETLSLETIATTWHRALPDALGV
ncbi:MAG: AIR synthase related protein, partial [Actinobacteria bacterium]|nr:AIR synthase related protein [Actinomycetota bacterium]